MKKLIEITRLTIAMSAMTIFIQNLNAQQTILGTTGINAYIEEAPGVPNTLEEAARRAFGADVLQPDALAMDNFYLPFEEKVNRRIEEYQEYARQKMEQHNDNASVDAYQAQAMKDINKNPIIANMGGYEKISQMSEEEARAAATQATAQYVADPFAANGIQSAGMTALYQKIVSDPAYAKKFEKMSDAEKEAELRKYMANDQPVVKTPAEMEQEHRKFEAQQLEANRIRNAQEVQLKLAEWQQQLSAVALAFGQKINEIEQSGFTHEAIDAEFQSKYEKIPLVVLGEMREKDPAIEGPLRIETAEKHRNRALSELKQYAVAQRELADRYQPIVAEYLDWFGKNKDKIYGGVSVEDMLHNLNTELPMVSFEASLVGIALELSKQSRDLVSKSAAWERNFQEVKRAYR